MKYITTSLLSSFKYWQESEKPIDEFMNTLNKIKTPTTEAMQRGIDFENDIQQHCIEFKNEILNENDKISSEYANCIYKITNIVKGGLWQCKVQKEIKINNQDFMLFGYADVIKENAIYDIKTTAVYELGKYNTSTQHLIYMYCTGIKNFEYLIAQGGETLENFYRESYSMQDDCESKIRQKISEFLSFLDNCEEAKIAYNNNWDFNK